MNGSLINNLMSRSVNGQPVATVGMGATVLGYTDRKAATIIDVKNDGKFITVQYDTAVRTDKNGMSEMQSYDYTANSDGIREHFKQDKNGMWYEVAWNERSKRWNKIGSNKLQIGVRNHYHDFSF